MMSPARLTINRILCVRQILLGQSSLKTKWFKKWAEKAELHYFKKLGNDLLAIDVQQLEGFLEKQILFDLEVLK